MTYFFSRQSSDQEVTEISVSNFLLADILQKSCHTSLRKSLYL